MGELTSKGYEFARGTYIPGRTSTDSSCSWQYPAPYPIIVGHEIVGEVVRVGSQAAGGHKVGDRVGVGCLADNCEGLLASASDSSSHGNKTTIKGPCVNCSNNQDPAEKNEQFCPRARWTYPGPHHNGDKGYGGYATHHRTPGRFAFAIPAGLSSAAAATMMCAGVTMYSPLKRWLDFDPADSARSAKGKKVGIVGLGGLGHYGVLFARAMGADLVLAISRKEAKREEALRLGAHDYLASEEGGKGWFKKYYGQLDLLISTVASAKVCLFSGQPLFSSPPQHPNAFRCLSKLTARPPGPRSRLPLPAQAPWHPRARRQPGRRALCYRPARGAGHAQPQLCRVLHRVRGRDARDARVRGRARLAALGRGAAHEGGQRGPARPACGKAAVSVLFGQSGVAEAVKWQYVNC